MAAYLGCPGTRRIGFLAVPKRLVIEEIAAADRTVVAVVDGREILRGNSLARLLREVGGYEGEIAHPTTGEVFPVSLAPWAECDPQTTWLTVRFESDLPPMDWDELGEID